MITTFHYRLTIFIILFRHLFSCICSVNSHNKVICSYQAPINSHKRKFSIKRFISVFSLTCKVWDATTLRQAFPPWRLFSSREFCLTGVVGQKRHNQEAPSQPFRMYSLHVGEVERQKLSQKGWTFRHAQRTSPFFTYLFPNKLFFFF